MNRYDLHIHSDLSFDSVNKPETILKLAKKEGLNGIAITDHGSIKGALLARKLNKDKSFEVIVGQEVATDCGDVIALYIKKEIKGKRFFKVLESIKRQGGLIIIPHPFRIWPRFCYSLEKLDGKIDAIESVNSRYMTSNMIASSVAKRLSCAQIGSSDSHSSFDIGRAYTSFEGDLRSAIRNRKTKACGSARCGLISQSISNINAFSKKLKKYLKTS